MHELSIAHQLVSVASEAAVEAGAVRVNRVVLRLGVLAGVVREALEFAYEIVIEGTPLAGSKLVIEPVDLLVRCDACGIDTAPCSPARLRCPRCDAPTATILAGRELELRSIDYDTAADLAPSSTASSPVSAAHGAEAFHSPFTES